MSLDVEQQKALAAGEAAKLVQDKQIVGLGSGTTVAHLLQSLARRVHEEGLRFTGVPTSQETAHSATTLGLAITDLEQHPRLDIDIDGADELDPRLNLIKGHGGALLREKIVAAAAGRFIVIADQSKCVERLGQHKQVPIEVVEFGWTVTRAALDRIGAQTELRGGDQPFHTDNGNLILDSRFPSHSALAEIAARVKALPGVVEHGFFLGMASSAIVGRADGSVKRIEKAV